MKNPNKILIVGSGTAGLVAALILKTRFFEKQIDVVGSSNIGIVGVGEGSTEHWKEFMDFVGIDQYELIKEADATYKAGIMFKDWTEENYLHSIQPPYDYKFAQYRYMYGKLIGEGRCSREISSYKTWENMVNTQMLNAPSDSPTNQYHFNTHKLNDFLTKVAKKNSINFFDDDITDVKLNDQGEIKNLIGNKKIYDYDFYIDATGFKRLLISKFNSKWISFKEHLKLNSAIAFPTKDTENYNMWTLSKAMDYGWLFRIPVWGRGGNGYIFDDEYIDETEAKIEVEKYLGHEIEIGKKFKFDPGYLKDVWIKNCCAMGLSAAFVEPLEASSIGTSIQQSFLLMHRIPNYNDDVIKTYNDSFSDIMINIRDFIFLHYMVKKNHTPFWSKVSNLTPPETLMEKMELWKHRLPIAEDFNKESDYILFKEAHYIMVLHGLGFFDPSVIKQEYENLSNFLKDRANEVLSHHENFINSSSFIPHKVMLNTIRSTM